MQHYQATNFGNIGYDDAQLEFKNIKKRDNKKRIAAINAGYDYLEIHYKYYAKLNEELLANMIFGAINE